MKIYYISNTVLPSESANLLNMISMSYAFSLLGHDVTVILPEPKENIRVDELFDRYGVPYGAFNIRFVKCNRFIRRSYSYGLELLKLFLRERPDFVFGRFVIGCFLSGMLGIPTILELSDVLGPRNLTTFILSKVFPKTPGFRKIITISRVLRRRISVIIGAPSECIESLPLGSIIDLIDHSVCSKFQKRRCNVCVGYVGGLAKYKGAYIVEILAKLIPSCDFVFVGSNVFHSFNITSLCKVSYNKVYNILKGIDICLLPNVGTFIDNGLPNDYTSPLKLFDYMAVGKPVVFSDMEVLREVAHNKFAIAVCPGDIQSWVTGVEKLAYNRKLSFKMGVNSRKEFGSKYCKVNRAKSIIEIFRGKFI